MARRGSRSEVLRADVDSDDDLYIAGQAGPARLAIQQQPKPMRPSHPRAPPTPSTGSAPAIPQSLAHPLLPSAPASPPTPAPSPTPHQRQRSWNPAGNLDDTILRDFRLVFSRLDVAGKEAWLEDIVDSCDNHLLSYLHHLVSPRLKKDPFHVLPNELCFRVSLHSCFATDVTWSLQSPDSRVCRRPAHLCASVAGVATLAGGAQRRSSLESTVRKACIPSNVQRLLGRAE